MWLLRAECGLGRTGRRGGADGKCRRGQQHPSPSSPGEQPSPASALAHEAPQSQARGGDAAGTAVAVSFDALAKHEVSPKTHPKAMLRLTRAEGGVVVIVILEATKDRAYAVLCDAKLAIARGGVVFR